MGKIAHFRIFKDNKKNRISKHVDKDILFNECL